MPLRLNGGAGWHDTRAVAPLEGLFLPLFGDLDHQVLHPHLFARNNVKDRVARPDEGFELGLEVHRLLQRVIFQTGGPTRTVAGGFGRWSPASGGRWEGARAGGGHRGATFLPRWRTRGPRCAGFGGRRQAAAAPAKLIWFGVSWFDLRRIVGREQRRPCGRDAAFPGRRRAIATIRLR